MYYTFILETRFTMLLLLLLLDILHATRNATVVLQIYSLSPVEYGIGM